MKRFVIRGINELGERVYDYLRSQGYEVVAASDNDPVLIGRKWHDVVVYSPNQILEIAKDKGFDGIVFALRNKWIKEITDSFKNQEWLDGYMIPTYCAKFHDRLERECFYKIDFSRPRLKQFDVNIVDHCNMKCKGCLRYSNLVDEPAYADFDGMIRDWKQIKRLFWGVERVKLMGGEPMLNPNLCDFIREARSAFPDADVMVTTNALLINENCHKLFETMKENNVFFDISLYQPLEKKIDRIKDILDSNGVWYEINSTKGNFYKIRSAEPRYNPEEMYEACQAKNCHHLREGKISVCSAPQYAHYMNERYGTKMPTNAGVYDIYDSGIDSWELDDRLSHSFENCRYCAPPVEFKWERADSKTAKMSDWFV